MDTNNLYPSEYEQELQVLKLENSQGTALEILNFGAAIFSLRFVLQDGKSTNVVVSPKETHTFLSAKYKEENKCFGASIGRYAGRISHGGFSIDEEKYSLFTKNGVHLHGGDFGFSYKMWKIEKTTAGPNPSALLSYISEDGEEGYPGNLQVSVLYVLTEENEVLITYRAETDKASPVNLTNHTYFNLNGEGSVKGHELQIPSEKIVEVDEKLIPTGSFKNIKGDKKDFSQLKPLGELNLDDVYALPNSPNPEIILKADQSGILLRVESNQPACVVYVPPTLPQDWEYHTQIASENPSICLETQNFPDAPHHSNFPSCILRPGEAYINAIRWKFSVPQ